MYTLCSSLSLRRLVRIGGRWPVAVVRGRGRGRSP